MLIVPHAGERFAVEIPVTEQYASVAEALQNPKVKKFATVARGTINQDLIYDDNGDVAAVRLGIIPGDIGERRVSDAEKNTIEALNIEDDYLSAIATMVMAAGSLPDVPEIGGGKRPG